MVMSSDIVIVGILAGLCIILIFLLKHALSRKRVNQLEKTFAIVFVLLIFWMFGLILQILCVSKYNMNPIYFDYLVGISACFLPVAVLLLSIIFARTKIKFNIKYFLLFIIPTICLTLLWTNSTHHLFYKEYSTNISSIKYGAGFYLYYYYTIILYAISLFIFIKYSIKNSGLFSTQAVLIFIGTLTPIVTNLLGLIGIVSMPAYITPMTFSVTIICVALAMFKFSLLKGTPIALQRIVDRISDSYIVLNDNYEISDFNRTFIKTFRINDSSELRGKDFSELLQENSINQEQFTKPIELVKNNNNTESFELNITINKKKKSFNVEVTSIIVKMQFLGILILFKDITQHVHDMEMLKNNQDMLMENERLASLGQLIGGIAHNLKTPIMSIAGATEGLEDLIKEYDSSIDDPEVNSNDHHEIAKDMNSWVEKIRGYTEYMSDIITTVKGQAVTLGTDEKIEFTIEELIKRVDILMKHELKNALVYLNISMLTDEKITIRGDANSLVQVINNMISNAIQAYNGKPEQVIDMIFRVENNDLIISLKDYAGGLPEKVKQKLFKEMITTKGKNGTGLGLYMSYSNIKARFNGDITFESNNEGTTFNIIIPLE